MMTAWNLWAAWIGILAGMLGGAVQGLFFHREDWLGGYASWRRRLMRLGHISFFGLAGLNLALVLTLERLGFPTERPLPAVLQVASISAIAGAALMPLICYLSAWRKPVRNLFFLPVSCLLLTACLVLLRGIDPCVSH